MYKNRLLIALITLISISAFAQTQRITLNPSLRPFYHGVESGDPTDDHVIVWTRVTPDTGTTGDIEVDWQMATDTGFTNIVNFGKAVATEVNHYCVKVDVCGLQPSQFYYYMFNALGRNSIVGRTKTAPGANSDNDSVRFAVVSCASWEHGYFNAYESISNKNTADAVVHLGDYIYEFETGGYGSNIAGRTYDPPTECITELGYELRYSQYKLDDQLRRTHQLFPFISVWDDHETANNAWRDGAGNHTPGVEGNYSDRKRNSTSTYFKWMPVRKPDPADTLRIFRKLRYGKLLDLVMLDTRLYDKDEQDLGARNDPNRHMMGPAERAWFFQQLDDTSTRWKIVGNQVMFAPLEVFGQPVNNDQWDGYNYERGLIEDHILNTPVKNVVVLTGDIHTSWCNDIPGANYNSSSGSGSVGVEFVGPSLTSASSPLSVGVSVIKSFNQHMKYINLSEHGYYDLDIKKGRAQADYTFVSTVTTLGATDAAGGQYYVNNNERFLRQASSSVPAPVIPAPKPSTEPNQGTSITRLQNHSVTLMENSQVTVNVVPDVPVCPALNLTVLPAQHGVATSPNGLDVTYVPAAHYSGYDTLMLTVCSNEQIPVCDTVYIFATIVSVQAIDTFKVDVARDSFYSACLHFNDITFYTDSIHFNQPAHGTIGVADSCFTYTIDSGFVGFEQVTFVACQAGSDCDTIVYIFRVDHPVVASTIYVELLKNSNATQCLVFDDLSIEPQTIQIIRGPQHGTSSWVGGDSCIKYSPHFNYTGYDTMRFVACDGGVINHCDTITIICKVNEPTVTAVQEQSNMVVLGMYPNPVADKLIVQCYLYEAATVSMNVFSLSGSLISTGEPAQFSSGIHHLELNTNELATGTYVIELKAGKFSYRKQIVKQ